MTRDELCQEIRRRTPIHADELIDHLDAYVENRLQAERDRTAQAIDEASKLSYNAQRPDVIHGMRVAARIARAES